MIVAERTEVTLGKALRTPAVCPGYLWVRGYKELGDSTGGD